MQERHAALDGAQVSDQGHVVGFLNGAGGQHGKTSLAAGHHVAVVAENAQRVGGQGAGGHVEHAGQQLAADLVHIGDHQQQALGSGERGGESASGQRAVHSASRASFALHFSNVYLLTKQILAALGGPFVDVLGHGGGRRDGVDGGYVAESISDMADSTVAVDGQFNSHGKLLLFFMSGKSFHFPLLLHPILYGE